jgi:hypothetical protein
VRIWNIKKKNKKINWIIKNYHTLEIGEWQKVKKEDKLRKRILLYTEKDRLS